MDGLYPLRQDGGRRVPQGVAEGLGFFRCTCLQRLPFLAYLYYGVEKLRLSQ